MAFETADDRSIFLADFGETVSYTPTGGTAKNITGIFYNDYQEVTAGGSMGFALQQPQLLCRTDDVPNAEEGDLVTVGGNDFTIVVVMDDGTGMTMMMLEAV